MTSHVSRSEGEEKAEEEERHICKWKILLGLWLSSFLVLWPFNTVPHVVVTPTIKLFSLLLHNCNFATVMNNNANICVFWWSQVTPVRGSFDLQRGHRLRTAALEYPTAPSYGGIFLIGVPASQMNDISLCQISKISQHGGPGFFCSPFLLSSH